MKDSPKFELNILLAFRYIIQIELYSVKINIL